MTKFAVARVLHGTVAEGPGRRTAIWVQGCSIRCPGCINPHLFEFKPAMTEVAEVLDGARAAEVEGLTFLGGEPFDQADACAELAESARVEGLGVISFSGYTYAELLEGSEAQVRLLRATDLLVDGRYVARSKETQRSLVGSTNQSFVHLSERYKWFDPNDHPNRLDVRVAADGAVRLAGFLSVGELRTMRDGPFSGADPFQSA